MKGGSMWERKEVGKGGWFGRWIEVGVVGLGKDLVLKEEVMVKGIRGSRGGGVKGGGRSDLRWGKKKVRM